MRVGQASPQQREPFTSFSWSSDSSAMDISIKPQASASWSRSWHIDTSCAIFFFFCTLIRSARPHATIAAGRARARDWRRAPGATRTGSEGEHLWRPRPACMRCHSAVRARWRDELAVQTRLQTGVTDPNSTCLLIVDFSRKACMLEWILPIPRCQHRVHLRTIPQLHRLCILRATFYRRISSEDHRLTHLYVEHTDFLVTTARTHCKQAFLFAIAWSLLSCTHFFFVWDVSGICVIEFHVYLWRSKTKVMPFLVLWLWSPFVPDHGLVNLEWPLPHLVFNLGLFQARQGLCCKYFDWLPISSWLCK